MIEPIEATDGLYAYVDEEKSVPISAYLLSTESGLSSIIGCSVKVKQMTRQDNDCLRLTLELSDVHKVHPRAKAFLDCLRQNGPIVLGRQSGTLAVMEGSQDFIHICSNVTSIFNGLVRDHADQIELVLVEKIEEDIRSIGAKGGKKMRSSLN